MMSNQKILDNFKEDVDWNIYNSQNNISNVVGSMEPTSNKNINVDNKINTLLGNLPKPPSHPLTESWEFNNPKIIKEITESSIGAMPGIGTTGELGMQLGKKGIEYLQPQREAQNFMGSLGGNKTAEENIYELANRVNFSRKSAAEEALSHKRPVYEELGEKEMGESNYLTNNPAEKWYSSDLKDFHNNFKQNKTLNSSDELSQQLGDRIGRLKKLNYEGKLDREGQNELRDLGKAREMLSKDQDQFIESQSPELGKENKLFRKKWQENVSIYDEYPILAEMARKGTTEGISQSDIKRIFSYPSKNIKKIASDIGKEGKKNVLYNELQSSESIDPEILTKQLRESKQFGYQNYVTPEMESMAKDLTRRVGAKKYVATLGGALGGYMLGNIPGAAIGAAIMSPARKKIMESILGSIGKK